MTQKVSTKTKSRARIRAGQVQCVAKSIKVIQISLERGAFSEIAKEKSMKFLSDSETGHHSLFLHRSFSPS